MNDTLTIKLTRAEKAAAKRLNRMEEWDETGKGRCPYTDWEWIERKQADDEQLLLGAVLRAMKKAGAK